jgi:hypothetical protein
VLTLGKCLLFGVFAGCQAEVTHHFCYQPRTYRFLSYHPCAFSNEVARFTLPLAASWATAFGLLRMWAFVLASPPGVPCQFTLRLRYIALPSTNFPFENKCPTRRAPRATVSLLGKREAARGLGPIDAGAEHDRLNVPSTFTGARAYNPYARAMGQPSGMWWLAPLHQGMG